MRDTLFRGKRIDTGEWVYGDKINEQHRIVIQYYKDNKRIKATVIPETIGQYIGLNDKYKKMIFENDIVNDEESGYNYYIKWFSEYACFSLANKSGHMEFCSNELEIFLNDLVVIGNIYDNPQFAERRLPYER